VTAVDRKPPAAFEAGLDYPLPTTVAVGGGTAVFVCGWCFSRHSPIRCAWLEVDGERQELLAFRAPRRDVLEQNPSEPHAYRSGFWGIARIRHRSDLDQVELAVAAELVDGRTVRRVLATVSVDRPCIEPAAFPSPHADGRQPLVAIAMATYEPDRELFRAQIESIRAQTHRHWICVISDDRSSPAGLQTIREVIGDDPRFVVSVAPERLRFYRNFERALQLVPSHADFVALADQDDRWRPDKLERLLGAIGSCDLVYSDQRIVDRSGEEIAPTYWNVRSNDHEDVASLLFANCVTGAASLLRRDLLDVALPFPPRQFANFHDHWLALVARLRRGVAYVPDALGDYVQHRSAVLGHGNANRMPTVVQRVRRLREDPRQRLHRWRLTYFVDCCRLLTLLAILELRLGDALSWRDRRQLGRFARAERSPLALAWLALRAVRELRGRPRTLAAELGLLLAYVWRWLVRLVPGRAEKPGRWLRVDARPPARLIQEPGRRDLRDARAGALAAKIAPLDLAVSQREPERVNMLIPHVDLKHLFGGYITKFQLALALAERGWRVRIVTVDPQPPLPGDWPARLARYSGLEGIDRAVEFCFGRESEAVPVSRNDAFVATTWWTAHVAHAALRELGRAESGFLYLIQEYEPFTFPMGSYAALAERSYTFPHAALFSTELLCDFFSERKIGVFAEDRPGGAQAVVFRNAITNVASPDPVELRARRRRRLLFYARPEPHAARNMYELGVLGLAEAARRGVFSGGKWELNGIGSVEGERRLELAPGVELRVGLRTDQRSYAELLRSHDVGLALMHTPHPSLVPIEMAAAGLVVVTNTWGPKTDVRLRAISPNLVAAEADVGELASAIATAVELSSNIEARVRGARAVTWPRSRQEAFNDEVMERVESLLHSVRSTAPGSADGAQGLTEFTTDRR
jgi:glycosyltransferase involved in cell wall biosynthesis